MKHTPGPWTCKVTDYAGQYLIPETSEVMGKEDAANARLIAASPELLAALEAVCDGWENWADTAKIDAAIDQASAAIAKARANS